MRIIHYTVGNFESRHWRDFLNFKDLNKTMSINIIYWKNYPFV
jgi:hypothetical protein